MRRSLFIFFALCTLLLSGAGEVKAAATLNSFSFVSTSLSNSYPATYIWSVSGGSSGLLSVSQCPVGVSIKMSNGDELCNSPQTVSGASGNSFLTIYNVSGSTKTVTVTFAPKDNADIANTDVAVATQLTIGAAAQTITDFSATNPSFASGGTQTYSWSALYIPGVNLQFDCNDKLTLMSGSTVLQCGVPAFPSDLAVSGSQAITVTNKSTVDQTLTTHLFPAMSAGVYDATHAMHSTSVVLGLSTSPASSSVPVISSFTSSANSAESGKTIDFTWSGQNMSGTNIMFTCDPAAVQITAQVSGATTTLPCNTNAFSAALPASGSLQITVANSSRYSQIFNATLFPQDSNGSYLGQYSKVLQLNVLQAGAATPAQIISNTTPIAGVATSTMHAPITKPLFKGISDPQVKILQQFLAQNTAIYPLGLISGYFGSATEAAVQKFQVLYKLAKVGDAAYGFVGPATRAKINSLQTP